MLQKISKLIDVKSLVTLSLTVAFIYLACTNKLTTEYMTIYTVIIGFYFGTQKQKSEQENI